MHACIVCDFLVLHADSIDLMQKLQALLKNSGEPGWFGQFSEN